MIPDTRARVRRFPLAFARIRRLPLAFARVRRFPIVLARMPRLLLAFTGMRRLPLVLAALLAIFAVRPAEAQVQPCELTAYVIDPDTAGLNVRRGPSVGSESVARIDPGAEVTVIGASGNWLRIRDATIPETGDTIFHGSGWVYARMLGTQTGSRGPVPLVAEPRAGARVLRRLHAEQEVTLTGCRGSWARVDAAGAAGWLAPESQCSNQLTTCS